MTNIHAIVEIYGPPVAVYSMATRRTLWDWLCGRRGKRTLALIAGAEWPGAAEKIGAVLDARATADVLSGRVNGHTMVVR
ncbi:MAG: hypothetical protein PHU75_03780 [Candidatus Nanopelagicales bacterium]|nr:hypothetical protein [Candidatus Nanopelagicales bacterium]